MKRFVVLVITYVFAMTLNAQNTITFENAWKKVDSLSEKGLPKSALEWIATIQKKAEAENNSGQKIKAHLYRIRLESDYQEGYYESAIYSLENQVKSETFPTVNVLHSILGQLYWNYFTNNRYRFYNRTDMQSVDSEDIKTWTLPQILYKAIEHYNLSLSNESNLAKLDSKDFDVIWEQNLNYLPFQTSLLDRLGNRAILFFSNDELFITKPIESFKIKGQQYFSKIPAFLSLNIENKDTFSSSALCLKVFQKLIKANDNDANNYACTYFDLQRLSFVRSKNIDTERDQWYLAELENKYKNASGKESKAMVGFEIAQYYASLASKWDGSSDDQRKEYYKTALDYCTQIISEGGDSYGAINALALVEKIKKPNFSVTTLDVIAPSAPILFKTSSSNVDHLYCRIYKFSPTEWESFNNDMTFQERVRKLTLRKHQSENIYNLAKNNDFQTHTQEFVLDGLDKGFYVMLFSNNKLFVGDTNTTTIKEIQVSNLALINESGYYDADETKFLVVNRTSGTPISGATIKLYESKYSYITRKYVKALYKTLTTNAAGIASLKNEGKNYRYLTPEVSYQDDYLRVSSSFALYEKYEESKNRITTFLFADRGIYRPGQTLYFKGVMMNESDGNYSILPGQKTSLVFYDANYQKVSSLDLETNEYGSFTGSFVIPSSGMTGRMYITNGSGSLYFNVEEYKRPKFYSEFLPVEGSYKLGEKIIVKGSAKAYAGFPIDGAQVSYSVVRSARFPYWSRYYWYSLPYSAETVIANGTVKTNDEGIYTIEFPLTPDENISAKMRPFFTYKIMANVTDINGETRSSVQWVNASYEALEIGSDISDEMVIGENARFQIFTKNMNGKSVPTNYKISLVEIKAPTEYYFESLWKRPEYPLALDQYKQHFPNVEYQDDNNCTKWDKGAILFTKETSSQQDSVYFLDRLTTLKPGMFLLKLEAVDAYGTTVTYEQFITLIDKKSKNPILNSVYKVVAQNQIAEPGDTVRYILSSACPGMNIYYTLEAKDGQKKSEWLLLNQQQKVLEIPVLESYRGGFSVQFVAVKGNKSFTSSYTVSVPYSNRKLEFEYETFRDKLEPGDHEKWRIKISGPQGEKIAAEMLATLYDASLDAIMPNYWNFNIDKYFYSSRTWDVNDIGNISNIYGSYIYPKFNGISISFPRLNWFGYPMYAGYYDYYSYREQDDYDVLYDEVSVTKSTGKAKGGGGARPLMAAGYKKEDKNLEEYSIAETSAGDMNGLVSLPSVQDNASSGEKLMDGRDDASFDQIELRSNFNETAFFMPLLKTDENGNVIIEFTIPQSLTKWNFKAFAHTKDLKNGFTSNTVTTSKSLMVIPNAPRFLREKDEMTFTAKISNLSGTTLKGDAFIEWVDPLTGRVVSNLFGLNQNTIAFTCDSGKSTVVEWKIKIPLYLSAVSYRIKVRSGQFTDGEEMTLPILTNRILVTETLPLWVNGNESRTFEFSKLLKSSETTTLSSQQLTLEFSPNPVWYAVQALPYIMEYPYECAEQTFNRYYANCIATNIINKNPAIKEVFSQWETLDTSAFLSNLEKNQELKTLLLEETPWVLQSQNEQERKKRIALLFNFSKMEKERAQAFNKLEKLQSPNGGFPWYKGMPDDEYVTQLIVSGWGHLRKLGIEPQKGSREEKMIQKAVIYLDQRMKESYDQILKYYPKYLSEQHIGYYQVQYLYARSFYPEIEISQKHRTAYQYFTDQAQQYWIHFNKLAQGQIALILHRQANALVPGEIMKSLKETSLTKDEMGMYWRDVESGYDWWQAPIETQSVLIEAFKDIANDSLSVEKMQTWLLKQKQVQDWKTTKATADACYALLIQGASLSSQVPNYEIKVGNNIVISSENAMSQKGTGYIKTTWDRTQINPEMGKISIEKKSKGIAWGAMYWQYFEDLEKISPAVTPLKIKKTLYLSQNTNAGVKLQAINENSPIHVGDKVVVRIEVSVDRSMTYVHMKDMRASCFEPNSALTMYKYQSGVGYLENTRDASVNYFFSYLPKGTYVFEYAMNATHAGSFSNGITTIQCMYAPEFSSHSEGIKVTVLP